MKFVATKQVWQLIFFHPSLWVAVFGSGIRDPGWVKIRIRDKHPGSATLLATVTSCIDASVRIVTKSSTYNIHLCD